MVRSEALLTPLSQQRSASELFPLQSSSQESAAFNSPQPHTAPVIPSPPLDKITSSLLSQDRVLLFQTCLSSFITPIKGKKSQRITRWLQRAETLKHLRAGSEAL